MLIRGKAGCEYFQIVR